MLKSELRHTHVLYYTILAAIFLAIFALYAPSLRLTTLFDDAYIIMVIGNRSLLSVFDLAPYGALVYRPMSYVPWLLVRDWFGWFRPDMLHYLNVATHVLNTALLASLALRLGHVWRLKGIAFPALAALFFGLFPFSFQAVLWPSALPHPLMTLYGLAGVHAYLASRAAKQVNKRRFWLLVAAVALFAACLCHEQGFIFGILAALVECALAWHERRKPHWAAFGLAALMLAYAVFIKLFGQTMWTDPNATMLATGLTDWMTSLAYHAQGMLAWLLILLRNLIGLPEQKIAILIGLLILNTLGVLGLLLAFKRLTLGLLGLIWWSVAIAPSVLLLSQYYVISGPRLMYVASIGVALLYAGLVASLLAARSYVLKGAVLIFVLGLSAWCVPYVMARTNVTADLTASLKSIDQDLRASPADSKVLLIDLPGWASTDNPAFLMGSEGMLFFQDSMVPPSTMLASVGNTWRDTVHVRDIPTPAYGTGHIYGVAGPMEDGTALKAGVLAANYVYRFSFDAPGLRVQRLAVLQPGGSDSASALAHFSKGAAGVTLAQAQAIACTDQVVLDLTWSHVTDIQEPVAVFVHGMDVGGQQVAVADRDPVGGLLPLNEIPSTLELTERRVITGTSSLAIAQLQVGVYSRMDGQRYPATRADGSLWEGDSVVIPVQVAPSACTR
jgi:hypothetical protein